MNLHFPNLVLPGGGKVPVEFRSESGGSCGAGAFLQLQCKVGNYRMAENISHEPFKAITT